MCFPIETCHKRKHTTRHPFSTHPAEFLCFPTAWRLKVPWIFPAVTSFTLYLVPSRLSDQPSHRSATEAAPKNGGFICKMPLEWNICHSSGGILASKIMRPSSNSNVYVITFYKTPLVNTAFTTKNIWFLKKTTTHSSQNVLKKQKRKHPHTPTHCSTRSTRSTRPFRRHQPGPGPQLVTTSPGKRSAASGRPDGRLGLEAFFGREKLRGKTSSTLRLGCFFLMVLKSRASNKHPLEV